MTINEDILDASISHSVWLERYKTQTVNKILKILNKADADLIEQIAARMAKIEQRGFDLGKATTDRLIALQKAIAEDRQAIFRELYGENKQEMLDFADYEADFNARIIEQSVAASGLTVELARPNKSILNAVVTSQPFRGRLLREWYAGLETQAAQRINDAIKIGIVEGQTTDQIIRRIRGTRANKFSDGILNISRRHASSVVRTATSHVSHRATMETYQANQDIVKGLKFIATLDSRTTPICRAYDNKVFKMGEEPVLPLHFNERSKLIAYLGNFKTKGNRSASGGPVPEDTNYNEFLRNKPIKFQEEALGVKKAKLFREGGLTMDKFVDPTGKEYTLAQLKERDTEIFNKVLGD
jgi:SPP1 gp7 family putative phage head morphogenesis protein